MYHHLTPISGVFLSAVLGILVDRFLSPPPLVYFLGFVLTGGLVLVSVIFDSRTGKRIQKLFGGCYSSSHCLFLSFVALRFGIIWIGGMNRLIHFDIG